MCQSREGRALETCNMDEQLINYLRRGAISSWGGLQRWAPTHSVAAGLMLWVEVLIQMWELTSIAS